MQLEIIKNTSELKNKDNEKKRKKKWKENEKGQMEVKIL